MTKKELAEKVIMKTTELNALIEKAAAYNLDVKIMIDMLPAPSTGRMRPFLDVDISETEV